MTAPSDERRQPPAFYYLLAAQVWDRFAYYAILSVLVLYLVQTHDIGQAAAYLMLGTFSSFAALTSVGGGIAADRIFGFGLPLVTGCLLMIAGSFLLCWQDSIGLDWGLGILVVGSGLFHANVAALLGRFYGDGDVRRQPAFTYFYMATNIGGMLGALAMGLIVTRWGYSAGFALAGVAKVLTLVVYLLGLRHLKGHQRPPPHAVEGRKWRLPGLLAIAGAIVACSLLIGRPTIAGWILLVCCIAAIAGYGWMMLREPADVRRRLMAHLVVVAAAVAFWAIYQQFAASVLVFTADDVQRRLLHWLVPASVFNSLNPAFVLLLTPVFILLWRRLAARGREPHDFTKLAGGIVLAGLAFWLLSFGIISDNGQVTTAVGWVIGFQFILALGEMLVGPVGLNLTTALAPRHLAGFAMGIWYLSTAAAYYLAGPLADIVATGKHPKAGVFEAGFNIYGAIGVGSGILVFILAPVLRRYVRAR